MQKLITRQIDVVRSPRVIQLSGLFDCDIQDKVKQEWQIDFQLPEQWNIGVVVGASGSGKTTIAKELWADNIVGDWTWDDKRSIVDSFPKEMSIKDICGLLSSVGFSSPPSWVKPFGVLSMGEKFRVNLARTLAESKDLAVIDEYTSVVDRTVAKIGSSAVAKTVRKRNQKLIALSCHYDILDWLEPDWVYEPSLNRLQIQDNQRLLWRRPPIRLEICRVSREAWNLFGRHHYLSSNLHKASKCFVGFVNNEPACFTAVLTFPHPRIPNAKREHRTVCLPDFQGVGLGNAMSDYIGSIVTGLGYRYFSQTSHPAMIRARNRNPKWRMREAPTTVRSLGGSSAIAKNWFHTDRTRLVASFEYLGDKVCRKEAESLWRGV